MMMWLVPDTRAFVDIQERDVANDKYHSIKPLLGQVVDCIWSVFWPCVADYIWPAFFWSNTMRCSVQQKWTNY
jgi:hypothetical protein